MKTSKNFTESGRKSLFYVVMTCGLPDDPDGLPDDPDGLPDDPDELLPVLTACCRLFITFIESLTYKG